MRKSIFFAVPLMAAMLISACADSGDDNNTPPAQTYDITGKIDYAGKTISSAKVCLDVNNNGLADDTACVNADSSGKYYFTSYNNPAYYPLAAFIKETSGSAAVSAKIAVESNEYDSILYAPRGKTDSISITTTLAKSLMDKDSTLTFDNAEKTADTIIKKADSPATVLTVYNNALNTAPNSIDISTSIRGLVSVITDKLSNEVEITDSTAIAVTQEEINTANDKISTADKEQPQEPQEPENPSGEPATPLEKVTEMLAGAEIKNAENPVNLNGYIDKVYDSCVIYDEEKQMCIEYGITEIGIKNDAFGGYTNFNTEILMTRMQLLGFIGYEEEGWPSYSELDFEVLPSDRTYNNEQVEEYMFTNHLSNKIERQSSPCNANGVVNGIYYKSIFDIELVNKMQQEAQVCYEEKGGNEDPSGEVSNPSNQILLINCLAEAAYNNKDNIKIEKWYWTIDTTQLDVCKN